MRMRMGDAPSTSTVKLQRFFDAEDTSAIPVASFWGVRVTVSSWTFIVAALVVGVVLTESRRTDDPGLVAASAIGFGVWITGWIVQCLAAALVSWLSRDPSGDRLGLGVLGVIGSPRPRSAPTAMALAMGVVTSVMVLAAGCLSLDRGGTATAVSAGPIPFWIPPSLGQQSIDRFWLSAGWLCLFQAICQMVPMRGTMGRMFLVAGVSVVARNSTVKRQADVVRRISLALAMMTALAAAALSVSERAPFSWYWLLIASVVLVVSSRSSDINRMLEGFQLHLDPGIRDGLLVRLREWQTRRRLRTVIAEEQSQAADAHRLDEVLNRLHRAGLDSLSEDDRKLLQRVSQNLRQERLRDASESADTPPTQSGGDDVSER